MRKPALPSLSVPIKIPHPIEQDDVPNIPRSLLYLAVASLFVSFILFIVSMLDLGYLSLFLNPPVSLFTIGYFTIVLVLSHRKREPEDPSYFSTVILCAYLLAILWLVALILTIVVLAAWKDRVSVLNRSGLHTVSSFTQGLQCFLCILDLGLVGGFAAKGHMIAYSQGDPEYWRPRMASSIRNEQGPRIGHNVQDSIDVQAWVAAGENKPQNEKVEGQMHAGELPDTRDPYYYPDPDQGQESYYRYPEQEDRDSYHHSEQVGRDEYYPKHQVRDVEATAPQDDYGIGDYYSQELGKNDVEVWHPETEPGSRPGPSHT